MAYVDILACTCSFITQDWGPAFVPVGVSGGVELVGFDRATLVGEALLLPTRACFSTLILGTFRTRDSWRARLTLLLGCSCPGLGWRASNLQYRSWFSIDLHACHSDYA